MMATDKSPILPDDNDDSETPQENDVPGTSGSACDGEQPHIPEDNPPPYSTPRRVHKTVKCDICRVKLNILRDDTSTARCPLCNEMTIIGPPPNGLKFVRCSCKCLLACEISTAYVRCCRQNCRKVMVAHPAVEGASPAGQTCTLCNRPFLDNYSSGLFEISFYLFAMLVMKIIIMVVTLMKFENGINVFWIDSFFPIMIMRIICILRRNAIALRGSPVT